MTRGAATQPFPLLLVLLDGLADWPAPELAGQTPLEAAATPHLDRLAREGASGLVYPLRPGWAPSSELAQWAMLGYDGVPFPGRGVLEALGLGLEVPFGVVTTYGALRSARRLGDHLKLQNWYRQAEDAECRPLLAVVDDLQVDGLRFEVRYLERGDALLLLHGDASPEITDSDPFSTAQPVAAIVARTEAAEPERAAATARALSRYLRQAHRLLEAHPINAARRARGALPLNVLVTKWSGRRYPVPPLADQVGGPAAIVASTGLYAGLAHVWGAAYRGMPEDEDPEREMAAKLAVATELLRAGYAFVHLHTKAADEAAHQRQPALKRDVIAAIDRGLAPLATGRGLPPRTVVAVTADHATPSWGPLLHTGDAVPLAVRGPSVRVDPVERFGERTAAPGALGTLRGRDVLPLLVNLAGRARFRGSRHAAHETLGVPTDLPQFCWRDD